MNSLIPKIVKVIICVLLLSPFVTEAQECAKPVFVLGDHVFNDSGETIELIWEVPEESEINEYDVFYRPISKISSPDLTIVGPPSLYTTTSATSLSIPRNELAEGIVNYLFTVTAKCENGNEIASSIIIEMEDDIIQPVDPWTNTLLAGVITEVPGSDHTLGYSVGIGLRVPLNKRKTFAIRPELQYSPLSIEKRKVDTGTSRLDTLTKLNSSYIGLPVVLDYRLFRNFYLEFGGQFDYLLSSGGEESLIDSNGRVISTSTIDRTGLPATNLRVLGGFTVRLGKQSPLVFGARYISNSSGGLITIRTGLIF